MSRLKQLVSEIHRRSLWQVLLIYVGAAWACFELIDSVTDRLGLPVWLPGLAIVLFLLGLPFVVATAFVREAVAPFTREAPAGEREPLEAHGAAAVRRRRFLTWRNAVASFVVALAVWGLVATGWLLFAGRPAHLKASRSELLAVERDKPAVAVLPFANLSGRDEDRYFADGFHEDVLNQLSKIASIDVLARQAVLRYRDSEKSPREIGTELSATAILEGSVRREADHIRINTQLINAGDEAHLWSEQYDERLSGSNIFSVQSRIAGQVAHAVGATLSPEEASRISYPKTQSLNAYDLYVRAQALAPGNHDERIRLLRLAIAEDAEFPAALAELSMRYSYSVLYRGWDMVWADSALALARTAIELAPDQPDGYRSLGFTYGNLKKSRACERAIRRLLELAPSDDFGIRALAGLLIRTGRLTEAVQSYKRGIALHPHDVTARSNLAAFGYGALGLLEQAEAQVRAVALLSPPDTLWLHSVLELTRGNPAGALALREEQLAFCDHPTIDDISYRRASKLAAMVGDYEKALDYAREAQERSSVLVYLDPYTNSAGTTLGYAMLKTGSEQQGTQLLEESIGQLQELVLQSRADPPVLWELAATYAALGRTTDALEWARKALEKGFLTNPRYVELDPLFDSLRGHPEFERVIARIRADQQEMARRVLEEERVADRSL